MNTGVQTPFDKRESNFLAKCPEVKLMGDLVILFFSFWMNLHTVFHDAGANLLSHQQCAGISFSPHSHQHLLSFGGTRI
jgi:hypothetical protein